jgi:hypothetical protein
MGIPPPPSNFLTPSEAARRAGVTPRCVINWCCRVPGLGVRVVGRWRVNPVALDRLLHGLPADGGGHARAA